MYYFRLDRLCVFHRAVCLGVVLAWRLADANAAERPNILIIIADDLGWNDVGYHGSHCSTPNIDRLVATGVELDQHYVQPVCSPTRTSLLSGRYPSRFGPHATAPTNRRVFPPGTVTLASALQSVGYETCIAGKWHLGSRKEWGPNHYGFRRSYGSLAGAADPWTHGYREGPYAHTWHRNHEFLEEDGNVTELLTDEVVRWIRDIRKPWFIDLSFTAVHIPIDCPEQYKKQYEGQKFHDDPEKDESLKRYAAFVSQMDAKIGQIVAALEETGQRENTLILFTSDNGGLHSGGNPYISDVPATPALGSNAPLRGQKGTLYEGGIRVPAWVSWPAVLEARKVSAPLHITDWMPTLTKLVGWQPEADPEWDGQDVWPLVTGEVSQVDSRTFYWPASRTNARFAIRDGDWKLIVLGDKRQLFNLADDPNETTNLAERHPKRVAALHEMAKTFQLKDLQQIPADLREHQN